MNVHDLALIWLKARRRDIAEDDGVAAILQGANGSEASQSVSMGVEVSADVIKDHMLKRASQSKDLMYLFILASLAS